VLAAMQLAQKKVSSSVVASMTTQRLAAIRKNPTADTS